MPHISRLSAAVFLSAQLAGCSSPTHLLVQPDHPAQAGSVAEPGPNEVVVVINNNTSRGVHAGIFAGSQLTDPAGSYYATRKQNHAWPGPTLADYVAFQREEDGDDIQLYRFQLTAEHFAEVETRMREAKPGAPLFCAVDVENMIVGIPPFEKMPRPGWLSPAELGRELSALTDAYLGQCERPDGTPCRKTK